MKRNSWLLLLLAALPFVLGSLVSVAAQLFFQPVPLLLFKVDLGMLAFLFGTLLSIFLGGIVGAGLWTEARSRRSLEGSLREVERGQRRFLRRLDHEIKNPLTGLQAALANVRESVSEQERARAAENAGRAVERLTRLLADLRKLADLEERALERLPVDIPELLEDIVAAVSSLPAHEQRKVNVFIARVPWPFPPVTGDRDLLGLVFYNLIENALKFSSMQDSVEVRALEDGRTIAIEVADSGPGVPQDDLERIFEELYRGTNARGTEGSGLGLALVRRIVLLHGGQVSVRSQQQEPRGTVFTIRLPAARRGRAQIGG
ncbi:MAG: sensor histidine kinase [Bacteroidota bacterium]